MQSEKKNYPSQVFEEEFTSRLRELRNKKKISAREMSISLGQNVNYINLIENGKRMPSMQGFFLICEFLEITPSEFFAFKNTVADTKDNDISRILGTLSERQIQSLISMVKEFKN